MQGVLFCTKHLQYCTSSLHAMWLTTAHAETDYESLNRKVQSTNLKVQCNAFFYDIFAYKIIWIIKWNSVVLSLTAFFGQQMRCMAFLSPSGQGTRSHSAASYLHRAQKVPNCCFTSIFGPYFDVEASHDYCFFVANSASSKNILFHVNWSCCISLEYLKFTSFV